MSTWKYRRDDGRNSATLSASWVTAVRLIFSTRPPSRPDSYSARDETGKCRHGRAEHRHPPEGASRQPRPKDLWHLRRDWRRAGGGPVVFPGGWRVGHDRQDDLRLRHAGERCHLWQERTL